MERVALLRARLRNVGEGPSSILDSYIMSPPTAQNAIDVFRGEWSSMLPVDCGAVTGAQARLFDDARLTWFMEQVGGIEGCDVLELGPLEGGHAWMCERAGAKSVTSVEANTRAYLKCLVAAQVTGMSRTRFLLGDFVGFLKQADSVWDVALACGVLYHMQQPAELIDLLSRRCRNLFVWTHYHDPQRAATDEKLSRTLGQIETLEHGGFRSQAIRKNYKETLGWKGFCGGSAEFARWLTREDLFRAFEHFGFEIAAVAFDQPDHPHGPAIAFHARSRNTA